ncbi:unnamed protein product [Ophioblennius macclurei]
MALEVKRSLRTATLLAFCFTLASSLQLFLEDGERTCFIHDIPEDVQLVGEYRTLPFDHQDESISIVAKDPDNEDVSLHFVSNRRFTFWSRKSGKHQLCLQADRHLKLDLNVVTGEQTVNYTEAKQQLGLTELQLRVWRLSEQLQQIQREQNYQRVREQHFRQISHNTHMWIFWWPVVRSLYVVLFIILITKSW